MYLWIISSPVSRSDTNLPTRQNLHLKLVSVLKHTFLHPNFFFFELLSLCDFYRTFELWKYVVLDSLTFLNTKQLTTGRKHYTVCVRSWKRKLHFHEVTLGICKICVTSWKCKNTACCVFCALRFASLCENVFKKIYKSKIVICLHFVSLHGTGDSFKPSYGFKQVFFKSEVDLCSGFPSIDYLCLWYHCSTSQHMSWMLYLGGGASWGGLWLPGYAGGGASEGCG